MAEQTGLQKVGLALQGFGAGFQGQGPQFIAGLEQRRSAERERLKNINDEQKKRMARAAVEAKRMVDAGQIEQAVQFLDSQAQSITEGGGDALGLPELRNSISDSPQTASDDLSTFLAGARAEGFLPAADKAASALDVARTRKLEAETAAITAKGPVTPIPQELLSGLSPDLARKGAAAFTAAGGGKDGFAAFQKIVDTGSEQERRIASPQILSSSFPQASLAEMTQLQSAMDSAKTTESGLKVAAKVRDEQKRTKKAQAFQTRAVALLDKIIVNPELGDVVGSIEGAIDFRLQDSESELIADIGETQNILTAENMDLMTGVLSESDIALLKNLASGALNRKRSLARFTRDATKMRDKLQSQLVVTIDEQETARNQVRGGAQAPPSGRQGGRLMTDAQGNRAFVFPDGSFEEVQ